MPVELKPVSSSLISKVGYDDANDEMIVEFPGRLGRPPARYAYKGELARTHHDTMTSPGCPSVGKHFLQHVKDKPDLPHRRLPDEEQA